MVTISRREAVAIVLNVLEGKRATEWSVEVGE